MNVLRTPCIRMISPGIGTRPNGHEAIAAIFIGKGLAHAGEIRVERCVMLIPLVQIAPRSICLPNFDQGIPDRLTILVPNVSTDNDPLSQRFTFVLTCQIAHAWENNLLVENWSRNF